MILGGAQTESVHRVMASVFDGDPDPLYELIREDNADEFVRAGACHALAMLTRWGELPRDETAQFLRDCYSQLEPKEYCFVWCGWLDAIAWLGLDDLRPLVEQAFKRESIDPTWITFEDFEQNLRHGVEHPDAEPSSNDLTRFGETVAELSGWYCFSQEAKRPRERPKSLTSFYIPERNPFRKVGRNDPCPCGSGRKFKKCCQASNLEQALTHGQIS
jgi:hypothetical protein